MRVIVSGGGTAGHVYPGLALLSRLAFDNPGTDVLYIGSRQGLESSLIKEAGYAFEGLDVSGFPRKVSISKAAAVAKMGGAVVRARRLIRGFKPDVVVGMGAYASLPVVLAARTCNIPTVIHEQNALPGLANRILGKVASAVAITYPATAKYFPRSAYVELTGNPIREDILAAERDSARSRFGLDPAHKVVLIFGGSRGARRLNDAVIEGASALVERGIALLHSTGETDYARVKEAISGYEGERCRVLPYIAEMPEAYAAADLVVSRAGATTVAEVTARGVPSILVPYPYATGRHQEKNAEALVRAGAARLVKDDDLNADRLVREIMAIVRDDPTLDRMASAARAFGRPDAAERLADLVEKVAIGDLGKGRNPFS